MMFELHNLCCWVLVHAFQYCGARVLGSTNVPIYLFHLELLTNLFLFPFSFSMRGNLDWPRCAFKRLVMNTERSGQEQLSM